MTTALRIGLELSSIASVAMAGWLVAVVLTVLPVRDPAHVPLWAVVAAGTTVLVAVALLAIRRGPQVPVVLAASLAVLSAIAIGFGLFVIASEIRAALNDDPEGYLFGVGLILTAEGVLGLGWLVSIRVRQPR